MQLNDAPRNRYFKVIDEQSHLFGTIGYVTWNGDKEVFIAVSGRLGIWGETYNPKIETLDSVTLVHTITVPIITEETKIQ